VPPSRWPSAVMTALESVTNPKHFLDVPDRGLGTKIRRRGGAAVFHQDAARENWRHPSLFVLDEPTAVLRRAGRPPDGAGDARRAVPAVTT
jgi:hypothetical protein